MRSDAGLLPAPGVPRLARFSQTLVQGRSASMQIRGIVHRAVLEENRMGSDRIEMILWGQGVGPDKPRWIVIPYDLLLEDPSLDPDQVRGHGFQASIREDDDGRWIVEEINFATGRVLRPGND